MSDESGRAWIVQQALELARVELLPIENPSWAPETKGGKPQPEPRLCFDLRGKRHFISFADAEIDDCAEPAYESARSIVSQRLREAFRRLKRQTK